MLLIFRRLLLPLVRRRRRRLGVEGRVGLFFQVDTRVADGNLAILAAPAQRAQISAAPDVGDLLVG